MTIHLTQRLALTTALAVLVGTFALPQASEARKKRGVETPEDLMIVDCLLRPKVRRIGKHSSYLAPRLPVRTSVADCRIRGGEYTEPDQANYATSLRVWLPQARGGDVEAMFYVAQIYERGLGTQPDYALAAEWYDKAAKKGYNAAMINLGYLYEAGLGVPADREKALSLYRRAAGGEDDLVVMAEGDLATMRAELAEQQALAVRLAGEVSGLLGQVARLEAKASEGAQLEAELASVRQELAEREKALTASKSRVVELEGMSRQASKALEESGALSTDDLEFGRYYALVIGNSNYEHMPAVETAAKDAREVAKTLENLYGYRVELLLDATRFETMRALDEMRETLTENDNLLVFYSGHGTRDDNRNMAYWQPVDARPGDRGNWIPSGVLSDHLDVISAKHVMVVADSAFSGIRSRSSIAKLPTGQSPERRAHYIRGLLSKRSRLVLANTVRADGAKGDLTGAFLNALRTNDGVLEASRMYVAMTDRMVEDKSPPPQFATLRWARNDLSEYFFVRQGK